MGYSLKEPYYQKNNVKLYHGNALEILPALEEESFDACVFDPPYGESQGLENDDTIEEATGFLEKSAKAIYPKLKRGAALAGFWTFKNLDVLLDTLRKKGWSYRRTLTMYLPNGSARPDMGFLPRSQPICLFNKGSLTRSEKFPKAKALHSELAELITSNLQITKSELASRLGCDSRLIKKWTDPEDRQWCFPGESYRTSLKRLLGLGERFEQIIEEWENRNPENQRQEPYNYRHDCYVVDKPKSGSKAHPTEKPTSVTGHLVHTLADKGERVLDPACGSGTTLQQAFKKQREAVGIEVEEAYCEKAAKKLENAENKFFEYG